MAVYAGMVTGMDRHIGRRIADSSRNGQLGHTSFSFSATTALRRMGSLRIRDELSRIRSS